MVPSELYSGANCCFWLIYVLVFLSNSLFFNIKNSVCFCLCIYTVIYMYMHTHISFCIRNIHCWIIQSAEQNKNHLQYHHAHVMGGYILVYMLWGFFCLHKLCFYNNKPFLRELFCNLVCFLTLCCEFISKSINQIPNKYFILLICYVTYAVSQFSSVQFSRSVMSDSLWPHGLQHARLPCPSPTPRACSNSCPSSRWCHPPSRPLSSPAPLAFNIFQHQGLF